MLKLYLLVTLVIYQSSCFAAEAFKASHPDGMTQADLKRWIASGERDTRKVALIARSSSSPRNDAFYNLLSNSDFDLAALDQYKDLASANVLVGSGFPPLSVVFCFSNSESGYTKMQWLIEHSSDLESIPVFGLTYEEPMLNTPLSIAVSRYNERAVGILLAAGAEIHKDILKQVAIDPHMNPKIRKMIQKEHGSLRRGWLKTTVGIAIGAGAPVGPVVLEE